MAVQRGLFGRNTCRWGVWRATIVGFSGIWGSPCWLPARPAFISNEQWLPLHLLKIDMKTFSAKSHEVNRDWFVVDGTDLVLGRLAVEIARRLRGKHKPEYTPHVDTGDFVVVVNADKIRVTGKKSTDKIYYRHSGYPGGIYEDSFEKLQARRPGRALELAVKGMLPKGPLGYAMLKKLKVYGAPEHPHTAQQPKVLELH